MRQQRISRQQLEYLCSMLNKLQDVLYYNVLPGKIGSVWVSVLPTRKTEELIATRPDDSDTQSVHELRKKSTLRFLKIHAAFDFLSNEIEPLLYPEGAQ